MCGQLGTVVDSEIAVLWMHLVNRPASFVGVASGGNSVQGWAGVAEEHCCLADFSSACLLIWFVALCAI